MGKKTLEELAIEIRRAYFREWRKKNPDKVRENNHRYWIKRAERLMKERENNNNK